MKTISNQDIDPSWTFIRYGTVAGWITVAMYRKPDGTVELVRVN